MAASGPGNEGGTASISQDGLPVHDAGQRVFAGCSGNRQPKLSDSYGRTVFWLGHISYTLHRCQSALYNLSIAILYTFGFCCRFFFFFSELVFHSFLRLPFQGKNEPCSMPAVCRAVAECLKAIHVHRKGWKLQNIPCKSVQ